MPKVSFIALVIIGFSCTTYEITEASARDFVGESLSNAINEEISCGQQPAEGDDGMCRVENIQPLEENHGETKNLQEKSEQEMLSIAKAERSSDFDNEKRRSALKTLELLIDREKKSVEKLEQLENNAKDSENLANELLEPYRKQINYPVSDLNILKDEAYASKVFKELDLSGNGILDANELKKNLALFDLNNNGYVETSELKWYFNLMPAQVNEDYFFKHMWKRIGRWYMYKKEVKNSGEFWTKDRLAAELKYMNVVNYDDDEDLLAEGYTKPVQTAILNSITARLEFNTAKSEMMSVQHQRKMLEKSLNMRNDDEEEGSEEEIVMPFVHNFGPSEKSFYFPEQLVCLRFHNFTHIFRVCPYHAVLRSDMQPEDPDLLVNTTIVGEWTGWIYSRGEPTMFFSNGAACGDGNYYKSKAKFRCSDEDGIHHRLVSVEKVGPCEYVMIIIGPGGCKLGMPMAGPELEKSTKQREAELKEKLTSEKNATQKALRDEL